MKENQTKEDRTTSSQKNSEKTFEKLVTVSLLVGIFIVSGFIIFYLVNPEPGYVTFGILNSEKKAQNYPTQASINESIFFYLTVENQLGYSAEFNIRVLKGTKYTNLTSSGSENATLINTIKDIHLSNNDTYLTERLNISFQSEGSEKKLIAELWQHMGGSVKFYDILFLRLNITT